MWATPDRRRRKWIVNADNQLLTRLRQAARPIELAERNILPSLRAIGFDWLVISAAVYLLLQSPWWVHPLLLLVIAGRQHALLILMHDGSHFLLSRDKRWNDLLSDVFCAIPAGIMTSVYRLNHSAHHEHLNTPDDPDLIRKVGPRGRYAEWIFPKHLQRFGWLLSKDILAVGLVQQFRTLGKLSRSAQNSARSVPSYPYPGLVRTAVLALLIGGITVSGKALMLLYAWLVPLLFVLPALLRLRSVAEHFALPKQHMLNHSRNISVSWLEAFLFAPHHVSMHLDHHLFPYVPWHRLPELHRRLLTNPEYRSRAQNNVGLIFGSQSLLADVVRVHDDPRRLLIPLHSTTSGA